MEKQLVLLESRPSWKLDRRTREIGLRGVAQARAALRLAAERRAAAESAGSPSVQAQPAIPAGSGTTAEAGRRSAA